jgi:hypothetical protein
VAVLSAACASGLVPIGPTPALATPTTFSTPGTYTYTVPPGVTSIVIDAFGAEGGRGGKCTVGCSFPANGPGGRGGEALGTLSVSPGDVLQIDVGGKGADGTYALFNGGTPGTGGTNGGATGGGGNAAGGGGGGATDVRVGSCAATTSCGLDARVIVAGGGGGGGGIGGCGQPAFGGGGGGDSGGRGKSGCLVFLDGGFGGSGGTGGAGGSVVADCCGNAGSAGGTGTGGTGGPGASSGRGGGGGGGGYGGGGGGAGQGFDSGEGGGGGGGLVPVGGALTAANNFASGHLGDGSVTISASTDSTPPVVTVSFSPNGSNGWFTSSSATGTITGDDSTTGGSTVSGFHCTGATVTHVLETTTTSASATLTVAGEGATSVDCTATDGAFNTGASAGSSASATVNIDSIAPSLTFTTVTTQDDGYLPGASFSLPATVGTPSVGASGSVTDGGSGVSSVVVNGVTATGSWAASGIPLNAGLNTVTATATDVAGNTTTLSNSVTLNLDIDGDGIQNNVDAGTTFNNNKLPNGSPDGHTSGTITSFPSCATVSFQDALPSAPNPHGIRAVI